MPDDEDPLVHLYGDLYHAEIEQDTVRYAQLHDQIYGLTYWCYVCQRVIPYPLDYHDRYCCAFCGGTNIAKVADGNEDY